MRNVDGRIPALKEGYSKLVVGGGSVLFADGAVPFGNGLWRDAGNIDVSPGGAYADKPAKAVFAGALQFDQALQTGHPVLGWGLQLYMKGTLVRQGLVGYKQTMTAVGQEANYLALLKGDSTKDVGTVRKVYADWVASLKAAADGSRLALFYANASGFPIMAVIVAANMGHPSLANATFGGWVEVMEVENQAVFVAVRQYQIGAVPST